MKEQVYKDFEIIFIDNGSTDGSAEYVLENYPLAKVIRLERNTGFSFANNLGIGLAIKMPFLRYVITLNNDTRVDPRYLEEMVACAERHPDAASVQPKVVNFFDKGVIDSVGILIWSDMSAINRGQKEKDAGQYDKEEEIFGASASAALYRKDCLETVKLGEGQYFDNLHFAYYEDVDLAWRLRLAGFSSAYCPKAVVQHVHSATGKNYSPFKAFHIHRNQYYNIFKNLPISLMVRALLLVPVRYFFLLASVFKKKGPSAELAKKTGTSNVFGIVFRSWWQVLTNMGLLMERRRIVQSKKKVSAREIKSWFRKYKADMKKIVFGE